MGMGPGSAMSPAHAAGETERSRAAGTWMPRLTKRLALAAAAMSLAVRPAAATSTGHEAAWRMGHHSFTRTLTYDDTLGDWVTSAGTMALRDRLQLLPPVPDRYGLFWNKQVVSTSDYEVSFTFSAQPSDAKLEPKDAVVAFWMGRRNFVAQFKEEDIVKASKDWLEGSKAAGLNSLLLRPDFEGFGLVFLGIDDKSVHRQLVSSLWSTGSDLSREDFATDRKGAQTKFIDWTSSATQVKIRVSSDGSVKGRMMTLDVESYLTDTAWVFKEDGVSASAYLSFLPHGRLRVNDGTPSGGWQALPGGKVALRFEEHITAVFVFQGALTMVNEEKSKAHQRVEFIGAAHPTGETEEPKEEDHWVEIFNYPAGTVRGGAGETWVGFSGWSGSATSVELNLHRFEMTNFDASRVGEEDADMLGSAQADWLKALEHERRFLDQASQAEAVAALTKLLTDHVDRYNQLGEKLRGDLVRMEEKLDSLGQEVGTYLSMAQAWVFEQQKFDPMAVKQHILGIRSAISKDKAKHDSALDSAMKSASALKAKRGANQQNTETRTKVMAVAELSKSVEDLAEKGSLQTNVLLLVMVVAVAGLGLLFLSRMRYYEKKHYI